jgi:predicted permease
MKIAAIVFIAIGACLVFNLLASALIFRDEFNTLTQKLIQLLFVWLVPLFGAFIVITIEFSRRPNRKLTSDGADHDKWENANVE